MRGRGRGALIAAVAITAAAVPALSPQAGAGPTGETNEPGEVQLIGDDAFVIDMTPAGWSSTPAPRANADSLGFAILGSVSGYAVASYTIRLVDSPGIERLRLDIQRAAAEIAKETGLQITVEPGVVADHDEQVGEVLVRTSTTSSCGTLAMPGIAGCGGPRTLAGLIVSGDASIAPQGPCDSAGGSVVAHELGHVFGLAHYSLSHGGLLQLMYPSTISNAPSFRSGDREGLRVLAGTSIAVSMLDEQQPVVGEVITTPTPSQPVTNATTVGAWFSQPTVQRVLDTRIGLGLPGAFTNRQTRRLDLTPYVGTAPIDAVVLNLTATGTTATGYVTAFPGSTTTPATSSLNYTAGADAANLVMVQVGASNTVDLLNVGGNAHLVADLLGVYSAAGTSGFVASSPTRVLDTRESTVPGEIGLPLGCGDTERSSAARLTSAGVPVSGATAEIVNLTAVETNGAGFISFLDYFGGPSRGIASTSAVNPAADDTRANLAITPGSQWIVQASDSLRTHVLVDLAGWFVPPATDPSAARFLPVTPERILDTRISLGLSGRSNPGESRRLNVPLPASVRPDQVTAVIVNLTVVEPSSGGYLTAFPAGDTPPNASNVNYDAAETVPNLAVVKLGADGAIELFASSGTPHLLADVMGFFVRP